jgi:restriction endonuclease Mrr
MSDTTFHYPADVFSLLVDTIPLLFKGKKDLMLFLEGAGVHTDDLAAMWIKVRTDRESIGKFDIVRDVLQKANKRGDSGLAARREIIKRVVEFEEFSTCWPNDIYKAKSNVNDLRKIVHAKDSFTRMKDERDAVVTENALRSREMQEAAALNRKKLQDVKERLNALFALDEIPQRRGKLLESVLNDLFRAYGIAVKEDFKRVDLASGNIVEQIDGVIEFDSHLYLVEMKCLKDPVGINEHASHMIRLFSRADARGIFISSSGFTKPVLIECAAHLNNKTMILATLQEFVMLLLHERDLAAMLRSKISAAVLNKNPYHEILS